MLHLEFESKQLMWRHLRTVLQTRLSAIALLIPKWTQGKALVQYNGWNNLIVTCIQSHRKKEVLFLKNFLCRIPFGHSSYRADTWQHSLLTSHLIIFFLPCPFVTVLQSADHDSVSEGTLLITNTYLPFNSPPKRRIPVLFFLLRIWDNAGPLWWSKQREYVSTGFHTKSIQLRGQNVCFTFWSHMTVVRSFF